MEVHSLVCNICHYMTQIKAFLSSTFSVRALNKFIHVSTTVVRLKENYIIFCCKQAQGHIVKVKKINDIKLINATYEYSLPHNSYNEITRKLL